MKSGRGRVSNPSHTPADRRGMPRASRVCDVPFVSTCSSGAPIDPRRAEGGDGAVAGRHASYRSSVCVLPQEAGEFRR